MSWQNALRWRNLAAAAGLVALAAIFLAYAAGNWAQASHAPNHEPADKYAAAGANDIRISPSQNVVLLSERIRTSKPTDLIIQFAAECELRLRATDSPPVENELLRAALRARVEIDGVPVPVATGDNGRVRICAEEWDRLEFSSNETGRVENDEEAAGAFNWVRLDVGPGLHEVKVIGDLEETRPFFDDASDDLAAVVQKRTMIIEPVKMPTGQTVDPASP